jgi:hypothetical protein
MRFSRLTAFFLLLGCLAGLPASARAEAEPVTVLAAGDIAFCERSLLRQLKDRHHGHSAEPGAPATAALLDRLSGAILVLGDLAYWRGTEAEFEGCYDLSWGRHKARSRPVPGNHEYRSPEAAPYYAYWGGRAGQPDKGYYSFDLGAWHLVALNSNLEGEAMAEQQAWLRRDLAASKARCILAYAHHPPRTATSCTWPGFTACSTRPARVSSWPATTTTTSASRPWTPRAGSTRSAAPAVS